MKVVVTGGSGFLGHRLVEKLCDEGHQVTVIDIAPARSNRVRSIVGDICSQADCERAVSGAEVIFHAAALYRDDIRPVERYYHVNVEGTQNVIRAATKTGVRRIVFVSSFSVYGLENTTAGEDGPLAPVNDYGHSKKAAEEHLLEWARSDTRRSLSIVRPCVIFGEGNRGNVYVLLKQIASGRFILLGDGSNVKSMSYVDNVAAFLTRLTHGSDNAIDIFNYADKPDMSVRQIVDLVSEVIGRRVPRLPLPRRAILMVGSVADIFSKVTRQPLIVNSERVRKFIADTRLPTDKVQATGFRQPNELRGALRKTIQTEFTQR